MHRINWERDMPTFLAVRRDPSLVPRAAWRFVRGVFRWLYIIVRAIVRPLWKPVLALIVLVTLVDALAGFVMMYRADREIDRLHAKGEPVTIEDFRRLPPPAGNKLFIPLSVIGNTYPCGEDGHDMGDQLEKYACEDGYPRTAKEWSTLHKVVLRYQPKMAAVEQWKEHPDERIWNDMMQHDRLNEDSARALRNIGIIREVYAYVYQNRVLLYAVNALDLAHQGKHEQAAKSILTGIAVSESVCGIPTQASSRFKATGDICKIIQLMAANGDLKESDMHQIHLALGKIDLNLGTVNTLRWIRARDLEYIRYRELYGYSGIFRLEVLLSPYFSHTIPCRLSDRIEGFCLRPFTEMDKLNYLRVSEQQIVICDGSSREIDGAERLKMSIGFFSRSLPELFIKLLQSRDRAIAEVGATQVILALHTCKQRFGCYPATLAECGTRLGWKLPQDPFSGKDFVYKRQGKGFFLYSVGRNLTDNGGRRKPKGNGSYQPFDPRPDDISWKSDR